VPKFREGDKSAQFMSLVVQTSTGLFCNKDGSKVKTYKFEIYMIYLAERGDCRVFRESEVLMLTGKLLYFV